MTNATPNISLALAAARQKRSAIERDGQAKGYDYVSADRFIEVCVPILQAEGLEVWRRGNKIRGELDELVCVSHFVLEHIESGEQLIEHFELVIKNDESVDGDKATLAALTTSWGYWLRDILALRRQDGIEVDSRTPADGRQETRRGAPGAFTTATSARPSSPEVFDLANPMHRRHADQHFDSHKVKYESYRLKFANQWLVGKPLDQVGPLIAANVFKDKKTKPFLVGRTDGSKGTWDGQGRHRDA